jgi:hypothetical protein
MSVKIPPFMHRLSMEIQDVDTHLDLIGLTKIPTPFVQMSLVLPFPGLLPVSLVDLQETIRLISIMLSMMLLFNILLLM